MKNPATSRSSLLWSLAILLSVSVGAAPADRAYPETFSYEELVALSAEHISPELSRKLESLTTTPFINNDAALDGVEPHIPDLPGLGKSLRLVFWNIERGAELDTIKLLLSDSDEFMARYLRERAGVEPDPGGKLRSIDRERLLDDVKALQSADVLVLNEVDWGVKRSGYRAVVEELGKALEMNWAYGVEFVEIDPVHLGTERFSGVRDEAERRSLIEQSTVDPERALNLHGTAILSRYPILSTSLTPFRTEAYDWFGEEKSLGGLEKKKRRMTMKLGLESLVRQIRRGGRTTLSVTLDVPSLPEGRLTIVSPHLENRTSPDNRRMQLHEVLRAVGDLDHPVIIAGDLNTTMTSSDVTTIQKTLFAKYGRSDYWVKEGIKYATGVGLAFDALSFGFRTTRFQGDPTAEGLKWVAPNDERRLFEDIEMYRFADGGRFDFRGDERRTINGREGKLANSNQRAGKGFATTFSLARTAGPVGRYKLDWIFVKSYAEDSRSPSQPYRFAPHFARTMNDVNYALSQPLSDHAPMSIDLPFNEPDDLPPPRRHEDVQLADSSDSWSTNRYSCDEFLRADGDATYRERLIWMHGYFGALQASRFDRIVDAPRVLSMEARLREECEAKPTTNLLAQARALASGSMDLPETVPDQTDAGWNLDGYDGRQLLAAVESDSEDRGAALIWLYGYHAGAHPAVLDSPVTAARGIEFIERLLAAARVAPATPVLKLAKELAPNP